MIEILKEPTSIGECLFFSNRTLGETGKATAWVYRPECPSCKKARIGKPIKKNGKPDKKAEYFECPECKHQISNEEAETIFKVEIKYTCPHCGNVGEATTEYKRESFKGVKAFVFSCEKCGEKIGITKKMKKPKK